MHQLEGATSTVLFPRLNLSNSEDHGFAAAFLIALAPALLLP